MFDQNAIDAFWAGHGYGQHGQVVGNVAPTKGKPVNPKKGSKNQSMATSLISEGVGTGGALAGAALGASIGSVVPGIGTAIGGIAGGLIGGFSGGTGGRLIENKVRDDEYRIGDALEEGAISGVLGGGVGNIAKLTKGGASALAGVPTKGMPHSLESALISRASEEPLKTSIRGKAISKGNQLLANQYGTIGKPIARATGGAKTVGQIADLGIVKPQDAERIAGAVTGADGLINRAVVRAVGGAKPVDLSSISSVTQKALSSNGLVDTNAKSLGKIFDAQLSLIDPKDPSSVLKVMKNLEGVRAGFLGMDGRYHMATTVDKQMATAVKQVRDELQESLFKTAGADKKLAGVLTPEFRQELIGLHPKNAKWQSFVDDTVMKSPSVSNLRSSMAPFVNIRKIIDEGELNSMTAGGRMGNAIAGNGGLTGMLAHAGASMVKDPASRAGGQVLRAAGNAGAGDVAKPGALGVTRNMGLVGGGGALAEAGNASKLGVSAYGSANKETQGMMGGTGDMSLEDAMLQQQGLPGGDVQGASTDMPGMEQPQSANPYNRENLLADIQRDPKNADKYIEYYNQLDSIFGASGGMDKLSQSSKNAMASSDNAINTVDQLMGLYSNAGNGSGRIGGAIKGLAGKAGFDESAKVYDNLSQASVTQIAKALAGSGSGTVSDMDAKVIIAALPTLRDNPNEARQKFAALRQRLETARNNTMMYGAGGGSSLEDALMQQQGAY